MHRRTHLKALAMMFAIIMLPTPSEASKIYGVFDVPQFEDFASLRTRIPEISSFSEMELYLYTKANTRQGIVKFDDLPDRLMFFFDSGNNLSANIRYPANRNPNLFIRAIVLLYDANQKVVGVSRYPFDNWECSGLLGGNDVPQYIQFRFGPAINARKFLLKYEETIEVDRGEMCRSKLSN
jgi:hypothetical protein